MDRATRPPPPVPSADAAGNLEQAILFMITAYLDQGLVERSDVINLLEDAIQRIERDGNRNRLNT
jgi:hypothetical protein